jgi:hypothetical protein
MTATGRPGPENEAQSLRRGSNENLVVSVVRNGRFEISTEDDQYVQLNERELAWIVEQAGPRALAIMRAEVSQ